MEERKNLTWYLGCIQKIVKCHEKGIGVDYVQLLPMNELDIQIIVKYYKYVEGFYQIGTCYIYD